MFVWTKQSPVALVPAWEALFTHRDGLHPVITARPRHKMATVDVYSEKRAGLVAIKREHGGSVRVVPDQNWAAMAPPPPEPIRIRDRLVIIGTRTKTGISAARKKFPGRDIIVVPPDMAFGTGHHATTATALRLLTDTAAQWHRGGRAAWTMIDVGTGSGILGIAARKLGASAASGFDFDPLAVKVANANARNNGVPEVPFEVIDALKWKPAARHDCVVANMFSEILIAVMPKLARSVKRDGVVIISGILHHQAAEVLAAGAKAGLHFSRVVRSGRWVTALAEV